VPKYNHKQSQNHTKLRKYANKLSRDLPRRYFSSLLIKNQQQWDTVAPAGAREPGFNPAQPGKKKNQQDFTRTISYS
jgi:hypothetical protein